MCLCFVYRLKSVSVPRGISVLLLVKQFPVIVIVMRKSRCVWCQCVCIYVLCLCDVWQDKKSVGAKKEEISSGDRES